MPAGKARPLDWNGDVRWLLERLLGLKFDQGAGTDSATIPLGGPDSPVLHYIRLTPTDLNGASEITLQLPLPTRQWRLTSLQAHRLDGVARTWEPHFGQVLGFAIDGPDDRLGLKQQPVTTSFRKIFCAAVPMRADGDGRLYLRPQFNAGLDNDVDLQFWFVQDFETPEST